MSLKKIYVSYIDNVLNNYIGLVQAALDKLREVSSNQLPRVRVMNTFAAENVSVR
jgi:hypothetical protein